MLPGVTVETTFRRLAEARINEKWQVNPYRNDSIDATIQQAQFYTDYLSGLDAGLHQQLAGHTTNLLEMGQKMSNQSIGSEYHFSTL